MSAGVFLQGVHDSEDEGQSIQIDTEKDLKESI
jgi:hypothetical protein